jgi:hypothetical protein
MGVEGVAMRQVEIRPEDSWTIEKLRRRADQHWEMAGLARVDRDVEDEVRHTNEARRLEALIRERM